MSASAVFAADSLLGRLQTYGVMLRLSLEERLAYRGDFALGTLMRFLPIIPQFFMWSAVFRQTPLIAGYTRDDMVAYLLLTLLGRAFSSMPGLASGIASQIRSGDVKKYLTQPVDMLSFLLVTRIAHKLVYYGVAAAPFAFVFYLGSGYFPGWPSWTNFAAFLASLLLGFALGFFLEALLGLLGFWLLEVNSLLLVYMLVSFFLSGHIFPLPMLPESIRTVVALSPFAYLAYFPAAVFLEKVAGAELAIYLAVEVGWVVLLAVACRVAFHYGVRRYSGYGG